MSKLDEVSLLFLCNPRYGEFDTVLPKRRDLASTAPPPYISHKIPVGKVYHQLEMSKHAIVAVTMNEPSDPNTKRDCEKHLADLQAAKDYELVKLEVFFSLKAKPVFDLFGQRMIARFKHRFGFPNVFVAEQGKNLDVNVWGETCSAKIIVGIHVPSGMSDRTWAITTSEYYYEFIQLVHEILGV